MQSLKLKAYALTNELDLNTIAVQCGIPKKYTWEEPLILYGDILKSILNADLAQDSKVMLFFFGSVVFINIPDQLHPGFIKYLIDLKMDIAKNWDLYNDDYELRIDAGSETEINDNTAVISSVDSVYPELAAIVIAKSVALEKSEETLGKILDKLESIIVRLENGRLRIKDKELAGAMAKVARHQYDTINYIMILDKPESTWYNSEANSFYEKMSVFFELRDRFLILNKKTDVLNNIIDGFSSISHSFRGLFIEWLIVILILVEIVLMTADLLF